QGSTQREVHEPELPTPMSMPDLSQTTPTIEPKPQAISSEMIMPEEIAQPDQIAVSTPEPTQTIEMDLQELQVDNEPLELMKEASTEPVPDILTQTTQPSLDESTQYSDYIYNPTLAADELGLPADLIDEFVGDFIIQAKKFQPDMESAVTNSDFDTVQILSHKLKGVAANLRIEDALEVLNVINSSKDPVELKTHIAYLTSIISKLEFGDQAPITPEASTSIETEPESQSTGYEAKPDDDIYDFNLVQNSDSKEQEYQKLSALVEELSHDEEVEEELPDLVVHEDAIHEEPVMQEEYPVIQEPIFEEPTELDYEIPVMTESTKSVIEEPIQEPIEETLPNKVEEEIHFDPEQTAKELGMDSSELNTYIQEFVDQANSLKTELENALKSRNFETVRSIASELKGASEALHMDYASQLLTHMQTSDEIRFTIEKAKAFFIFVRQL
ncbi:MAG: Hpt domain-containing protein, partial [Thiovulaceae bacterium]|nr:Hpt domain-containing protein [Sulfurimonadaceae bacterium]